MRGPLGSDEPKEHGMTPGRPPLTTIAVIALLMACQRGVTLSDADGTVRLSYVCDSVVSQATTDVAKSVVVDYAARIVRAAAQDDGMEAVMPLVAAADSGAYEQVEVLVIRHLCADGAIAGRVVEGDSGPKEFPARGGLVPTFALPLITEDGVTDSIVRLEQLRGQPVLLYFWATWCSPCRTKHAEMVDLAAEFGPRGIGIYGVLTDDRASAAATWLRDRGSYAVLFDGEGVAERAYQVFGIPRMYLVGPQGRLVGACLGCQLGSWHADSLRQRLDSVLSAEAP